MQNLGLEILHFGGI